MRSFTRCFAFVAPPVGVAAVSACASETKDASSSSWLSQQSIDQLATRVETIVTKWRDNVAALLQAFESGKDIDTLRPLSDAFDEDGDGGPDGGRI